MFERMSANAEQKQRSYAGLAAVYAASSEGWLAAHAQVTSDVCAADALLWSRGDSTAVAEFRAKAADLVAASVLPLGRPAEVVDTVRDRLGRSLSREDEAAWRARLLPLGRLDGGGVLYADQARAIRERRLAGDDEYAFVLRRRDEQSQQALAADEFRAAGDSWAAVEKIYAADLAGFEAWLVQRSLLLDDTDLVQAELRWALGVAALEQIAEFPTEPYAAAFVVRSRLAWVAGYEEVASLAHAFTRIRP